MTINKLHMHKFLRKNKQMIKPHLKKYMQETDRAFFDIRVLDNDLKTLFKEDWSGIATHFRCWVIAETLMDLDKNLQWWSGKSHRVMYRPGVQERERVTA